MTRGDCWNWCFNYIIDFFPCTSYAVSLPFGRMGGDKNICNIINTYSKSYSKNINIYNKAALMLAVSYNRHQDFCLATRICVCQNIMVGSLRYHRSKSSIHTSFIASSILVIADCTKSYKFFCPTAVFAADKWHVSSFRTKRHLHWPVKKKKASSGNVSSSLYIGNAASGTEPCVLTKNCKRITFCFYSNPLLIPPHRSNGYQHLNAGIPQNLPQITYNLRWAGFSWCPSTTTSAHMIPTPGFSNQQNVQLRIQ
jgi:hypothetical protein